MQQHLVKKKVVRLSPSPSSSVSGQIRTASLFFFPHSTAFDLVLYFEQLVSPSAFLPVFASSSAASFSLSLVRSLQLRVFSFARIVTRLRQQNQLACWRTRTQQPRTRFSLLVFLDQRRGLICLKSPGPGLFVTFFFCCKRGRTRVHLGRVPLLLREPPSTRDLDFFSPSNRPTDTRRDPHTKLPRFSDTCNQAIPSRRPTLRVRRLPKPSTLRLPLPNLPSLPSLPSSFPSTGPSLAGDAAVETRQPRRPHLHYRRLRQHCYHHYPPCPSRPRRRRRPHLRATTPRPSTFLRSGRSWKTPRVTHSHRSLYSRSLLLSSQYLGRAPLQASCPYRSCPVSHRWPRARQRPDRRN